MASPARGARGAGRGGNGPQGPTVTWVVWRGPAGATFDRSPAPVKDGVAVVTAVFTVPGSYILQARASDTLLTTVKELKVTVNPSTR